MAAEEWVADEIETVVSGFFTTHHRLRTATGALAEITIPAFRRDSSCHTADGRKLVMRQISWWKGEYELREGETMLGTAWPRRFFRREIAVEFGGQAYTLIPAGFWTRAWHLVGQAGATLLKIEPRGIFRRGAYITILGEIPVELLAFAYYLIFQRWQAEAAAAGAATAS